MPDDNDPTRGQTVWSCGGCIHDPVTGNSTGRVYVFNETVRAPCPKCPEPHVGKHCKDEFYTGKCRCQGRGWLASTDGWTWLDAAMALGILFGFPGGAERGFFATVTCTVEAMPGAKLMEMEDVTP